MRAELAAELVTDADTFAALESEWWALWRRAPPATPFQSPAWLIPWWRHFHPGDLFVVAVRYGTRLVALAPFYVEDGQFGRRILPVGISVSDYLDVLIDPDLAEPASVALVDVISSEAKRWDGWDLEELAPGAAALALPVPARCKETSRPQSACPVLPLQAEANGIWKFVPARKRRAANLARNRAARRGEVRIEQADAASAGAILQHLFRLHEARWRSRGEAGVAVDARLRSFHGAAVPRLLQMGLLRLYLLSIDGNPAAAHYGFMHRERGYSYMTGFDPEFHFESPGVILLAHVIEAAFWEGAREFHFLRGPEPYKYEWGASDRWNVRRSFRRIDESARHARS